MIQLDCVASVKTVLALPELMVIPSSQAFVLERVPVEGSVAIVIMPSELPSESKVMLPALPPLVTKRMLSA